MFKINKGASLLMAGITAFGCVAPALASNVWDETYTHNQLEGSDSNVDVNVLVQNRTVPMIFSAYVPATVKIAVSRDNQVITPGNLRIINGVDTLPIGVWNIKAKPVNGWTCLDWKTDFHDRSMTDQKKFAMKLNDSDLRYAANNLPWEIEAGGELPLDLQAKIAYQMKAHDLEEIMTVSFTMDWMDRVDAPTGKAHATGSPVNMSTFRNNLKNLTGTVTISRDPVPGDDALMGRKKVVLNDDASAFALINGQDATVYSKQGGGVFAPVNATSMFQEFNAKHLDVSGLDTSKVTNMYCMFYNLGSNSNTITFGDWDTSNVTNMGYMFYNMNYVNTLDLSSFDMNKVSSRDYMFDEAFGLRHIYCRSEADKAILINSNYRDVSANYFVVGHQDRDNTEDGLAHASGEPVNISTMRSNLQGLTGTVVFSTAAVPSDDNLNGGRKVSLNGTNSVFAVINGQNAVVYSKQGGGVYAPVNSSYMFQDYRARTLDVSGLDTSNVTNMYYMFGSMQESNNQNIVIGSWDTSKVTNMAYMFYDLDYVRTLDLSSFDMTNVSSIYEMFYYADGPRKIYCRTDADRTKMINSSSRQPSTSYFVVGKQVDTVAEQA